MRTAAVLALRLAAALVAIPWLAFAVPFAVGYGLDMAFEGGDRAIAWSQPSVRLFVAAGVPGNRVFLAVLAAFLTSAGLTASAERVAATRRAPR